MNLASSSTDTVEQETLSNCCNSKVDVHTHIMPAPGAFYEPWKATPGEWITLDKNDDDGAVNMMSYEIGRPPKLFRPVLANLYDVNERLQDMNRDGVQTQVLSVPPAMWRYDLNDPDLALQWCTSVNRYLADVAAKNPDRFVALGIVPLQYPDVAARVVVEAKEMGLVGVQVGTHVPPSENNPRWDLGETFLAPFFQACESYDIPVMVHPWYMCYFQQEDRMTPLPGGKSIGGKGAYWSPWLVGMGAEEANCILSLTASGLLHRFPTLKILVTHGGGGFPALKGRIEQGIRCRREWVWPVLGNHFEALGLTERNDTLDSYMDRIWVDSITHDPKILALLISIHGKDRVAFGSDYPFPLGDVTGFLGDGVDTDVNEISGKVVASSEHKNRIFVQNPINFFALQKD
jgi:aminocarboxymuconate-semialdehyde decarboxylase